MRKLCMPLKMIVLALILSLGMVVPAFAVGVQIQDEAGLLSAEGETALLVELEAAEAKTGWDIIILSIEDAKGKTARVYAEDFYDDNLVSEDGVSCVIDMDNREIALQTTGEAIFYLTDARIENILDEAYSAVANGYYEDAFSIMIEEVVACYDMGANGNYSYDENTGKTTMYRSLEPLEILLALVAALAIGGMIGGAIIAKYRLRFGEYRYPFASKNRVRLTTEVNQYVRTTKTSRRIPKNNGGGGGRSGGGGGGRSTVRSGSSGRSHGGGSRKF